MDLGKQKNTLFLFLFQDFDLFSVYLIVLDKFSIDFLKVFFLLALACLPAYIFQSNKVTATSPYSSLPMM